MKNAMARPEIAVPTSLRVSIFAMSKLALPRFSLSAPRGFSADIAQGALTRWNSALAAKDGKDEDNTISVLDPIGSDYWGEGVTAKRISAALRSIGKDKNVVVNINSPGGDVFEGIAIYNTLRAHEGEVTVRVIGLAASAASLIAMAGDRIEIGRAAFMMMHNVWVFAMGNRHDLREAADVLEPFDNALAEVYAARSGQEKDEVAKLMDKETWFDGVQAVDKGFADDLLPADQIEEKAEGRAEDTTDARAFELELAKAGMSRSKRRALLTRFFKDGTPSAAAPTQERDTPSAVPAKPSAGEAVAKEAREALQRMADRVATV